MPAKHTNMLPNGLHFDYEQRINLDELPPYIHRHQIIKQTLKLFVNILDFHGYFTVF